jgi:3-phytase
LLALAVLLLGLPGLAQQAVQVQPTVETRPVVFSGTAIQGAALWVHPTDPGNSLLLAAEGQNGLFVYQLDGTQRAQLSQGGALGVDVQENFRVGGITQQLVVVASQSLQSLVAYVVDPTTLEVRGAGLANITTQGFNPNSVALYASPTSGRFFAFAGSGTGTVWQFELTAQTDGGATSNLVRTLNVGGPVVGLAVDDAQGTLYVVEQNVGIWQYGAEPTAADARTSVDVVTGGGLAAPLGAVALYAPSRSGGYLLAVSGGANAVRIYDRTPSAHTFRGSFTVVANGAIDSVENPRHLVVSNRALGTRFPVGVVAVQDGLNAAENENFKLIPWTALSAQFTPNLLVDTSDAQPVTDGGMPDGGGADGGGGGTPPIGPPGGAPGSSPEGYEYGNSSCNCASASWPGTVLFVLAGVLLLSRRRRRA